MARTREIALVFGKVYSEMPIGTSGENKATRVLVQCANVLERWPGAVFSVNLQRATDAAPYIADAAKMPGADGVFAYDMVAADVSVPGLLLMEVQARENGVVVIAARYTFNVTQGLYDAVPTPPQATWVQTVLDASAAAVQGAQTATGQAERAKGEADRAQGIADSVGGSVAQAAASAAAAESSATDAKSWAAYIDENYKEGAYGGDAVRPQTAVAGNLGMFDGQRQVIDSGISTIFVRTLPRPNLLDNGGFALAQAGEQFSPLASGQYGLDRWAADASQMAVARYETAGLVPEPVKYFMRVTCDPSGFNIITQPLEFPELFAWMPMALAFYARGTIDSLVVAIGDYYSDPINSKTIALTDAWTRHELIIPAFRYSLAALRSRGVTFYTGTGKTGYYDLAAANLGIGTSTTPFSPLHAAQELANCQRYRQPLSPEANGKVLRCYYDSVFDGPDFPTTMRTKPTVTGAVLQGIGQPAPYTVASINAGVNGVTNIAVAEAVAIGTSAYLTGGLADANIY